MYRMSSAVQAHIRFVLGVEVVVVDRVSHPNQVLTYPKNNTLHSQSK